MALIEKGADASMFHTGSSWNGGRVVANLAFLAIGIGSGVLFGALLEMVGMDDEIAYPASIFIFAGLGLIVSLLFNKKQKEN